MADSSRFSRFAFPIAFFGGTLIASALLLSFDSGSALAAPQGKLITADEIKLISPGARDEYVRAIVGAEDALKAAGIDTRLRMAHFLTQMMTETGGLGRLDENLNYSFKSLMRVFSRKVVSEAKAREIAGNDKLVGNWVYRNRLGNGNERSGDGFNYRGSGFIQLTGRSNFRARGREIDLPLEENPELARQAQAGLAAAIAYWKARNINAAADDHDALRVRILVNGPAAHGFDQSKIWFGRAWNRVLRGKAGLGFEASDAIASAGPPNEAGLFDDILKEDGLLTPSFETDTNPEAARADAIKAYQAEVGLPETGVLDDATQDRLLDPREWRHLDDSDVTPTRPETDLEQTVTLRIGAPSAGGALEAGGAETEPSEGTGKPVADFHMSDETLRALSEARSISPKYEMRGREIRGAAVDRETFEPFAVIGTDTRVAVPDTTVVDLPARKIVQIEFKTRAGVKHLCTGAMISEDTVLTAAHCIHSGTSAGEPYQDFLVIPGRNKEVAPFGICHGREAFVLTGWTASLTEEETRNYDLGAIKLDCAVGNATGWLGMRTLTDDEIGLKTTVEGYAADRKEPGGRQQQWISEDQLRFLWTYKGFYQNDTAGGTSGSPVFATGVNDVLIGVHTNGVFGGEEPWASNNAFTRITADRLQRINEWIHR